MMRKEDAVRSLMFMEFCETFWTFDRKMNRGVMERGLFNH